jgi:hypothetical protein
MGRISKKLIAVAAMIKSGDFPEVRRHLQTWAKSDIFSYGLKRDLSTPFTAPQARVPITVCLLQNEHVPQLLATTTPEMTGQAMYERLNRQEFIAAGIPTGYVSVTAEGQPCYMQFLIESSQNERIQAYFGKLFPWLAPDEALLEYAFTPEAFQGLGIMPSAMAQIAERGQNLGVRWIITFVEEDNIAALKGCKRAGFAPYVRRHTKWRLFRRSVTFQELPSGTPYPFERSA